MRERFNELFDVAKNFEAYDWFQIFLIVIAVRTLPIIFSILQGLFMKHVMKMERMVYFKGWKKIKK